MSYRRVIPRDLFNEADLLKCYGRLYICLEKLHTHMAELDEGDGSPFEVIQDVGSGALSIGNLEFRIAKLPWRLTRPLNSLNPWPLYATSWDDDDTRVFTDDGELSPEFLKLIGGAA